jgi:hypothetical protein
VRLADLSIRRGELFPSLCQFPIACLELTQRLRLARFLKTLLHVADPSVVVLGRLAGDRGLGFPGLRRLWTSTHEPPFASYESAGDRLGERARLGK